MAGLTFSHAPNCNSFYEEGYIIGNLHLNYNTDQVRNVILHLKGVEKICRPIFNTRKHIIIDKHYEIWPKEATFSTVRYLNIIPFKERLLSYNLPETININNESDTTNGSVEYKLTATVNLNERWQLYKRPVFEIEFPFKRTIAMSYKDSSSFYPHKLQGKFKNLLEFTFELPHNKKFNLGTYVYIPMKIKYLKTNISVERIESYLMTYVDFRFNSNRNYRIEKKAYFPDVPRHEIKYEIGECNHTMHFFISRDSRPTYSSQLITITNELHIKICLCGTEDDLDINTNVIVGKFIIKPPTTIPISEDNSYEESGSEEDSEDDDESILEKDLKNISKEEPLKDTQKIIQQWKLNYGLSFDENNNVHFSKKVVISDDNELDIDIYDGKPMVYTCINSKEDYDDINTKPLDICINFPVVEITYNAEPVESFFCDNKEKLHDIYGHFLAKKFLAGGQLFIKGFNLVTPEEIKLLKFHLIVAYNSALYNNGNPFNNLSTLQFAPRIETKNGERIKSPKELTNWMNKLYQENTLEIIHYDDLISISQLRVGKLPSDDFETFKVSQPGIANFKEKLNLEKWIANEETEEDSCVILTRFIKNFYLLQGLIIDRYNEMKISEKFVVNFIGLPELNPSNDFYLEVNKPTMINKINPFVRSNDLDDRLNGIPLTIKYERYEVLLNIDIIEPSEEFKNEIEQAINSMKPFDALQGIFGEYGHLFPQRIVLGSKIILSTTSSGNYEKVDIKSPIESSLKPYLDKDSYFVTQQGDVIEVFKENNLTNWIQDNKNNLEIIELDKIIPLYDIVETEQQSKIHTIIRGYDTKQNEFRIIMTGITDLKDLDDKNTEHYKRINIEPSLKDDNYEVFGNIISGNDSLVEEHFVKFELFDFNGFYAKIKSSIDSNISIKECHIIWMMIGRPSKLSVFSPKNRVFLVQYFKESIKLQSADCHIKTPFPLSQGCCISVNANYPPSNDEPMNGIKLIEWSYNSIRLQLSNFNDPDETNTNIDLHICVLYSDNEVLKIDNDNREERYSPLSTKKGKIFSNIPLELIGRILTNDRLNENLFSEINKEIKYTSIDKQEAFKLYIRAVNLKKGTISFPTTKIGIKSIKSISNDQQMIHQLKLNHGLLFDGYEIQPSKQPIFMKDGELNVKLYNGQPIIYDDSISSENFFTDKDNLNNTIDVCINFPIAEIIYRGDLLESFSKCTDDENLYKLYGYFFARNILIGSKLFIKNLNLATQAQIDVLKFYLFCAYNSAKHSIEIPVNNLFTLNLLPKIATLDGEELNTHKKLVKWMNNLYQEGEKSIFIISYDNFIPISQLKNNIVSSVDDFFNENQYKISNFKENISLEEWVRDAVNNNLVSWIRDFHLFQGLIIDKDYEMEISKKIAITFTKIPKINPSDSSYLKIMKPSTKVENFLTSNNIYSSYNLNSIPFIKDNDIKSNNHGKNDENSTHVLINCEQYEILLNKDNIKPTQKLEYAIEEALNGMKPLKALQDIFDEYGQLFPQRIILGRSIKNILPTSFAPETIDIKTESLMPRLDKLNISYFLTPKGRIIENNDLPNWIQNPNNLEIIEFDKIEPLYKILKEEQQMEIDDLLKNNYRILMTGITDLRDLDNNEVEYQKRINIEPLLEDEDYEVYGSIISKNNSRLEGIYVNFGSYDINGFFAMIKKLEETSIKINECRILWMIAEKPSELLVFSPNNREFQIECIKESIILQSDKSNYYIKPSFLLSQGYTIFVHAYCPSTNYEPDNIIKLIKWSHNSMKFQVTSNNNFSTDDEEDINLDLRICVLCSDYKNLKFDNKSEGGYSLDLTGYVLTKDNFNESLSTEINEVIEVV